MGKNEKNECPIRVSRIQSRTFFLEAAGSLA